MSGMFYWCESLTELNLGDFDTSNVTTMRDMFYWCKSLPSLDLSSFNTENVTDMGFMFYECASLPSLDLSSFNTEKVTDMSYAFSYCAKLTSLNISSFRTGKVTNMAGMFESCTGLTELNLKNFDTSKVTDMSYMFYGFKSTKALDLSGFNTSNVTSMASMFEDFRISKLSIDNFDTGNVTDMSYMFSSRYLKEVDLSHFNTSKVTNMSSMFKNCAVPTLNVVSFDTSKVTNMSAMFSSSSLKEVDLSNFDTSNVEYMSYMFKGSSNLKALNLTSFNTSKVMYMDNMFYNCTSLTELDLSSFNLRSINNIYGFLQGCTKLSKIKSPYNLTLTVTLPTEQDSDIWYLPDATITTQLPVSIEYSMELVKNEEPYIEEPETETETEEEELEDFKAVLENEDTVYTYTGSAITPKVIVTDKGVLLTQGVNYTVKYTNNINVGTAKVTVTGKGNYSGKIELPYAIEKISLSSSNIKTSRKLTVLSGQKPKITVSFNGKTLTTKDYSVTYYNSEGTVISNGKYTTSTGGGYAIIKATDKGNFKDEIKVNVAVAAKSDIMKITVSLTDNKKTFTYTGSEITLSSDDYKVCNSLGDELSEAVDGENGDYIVTYSNNVKVGTAKVTFTGIGNFTGSSVTKTFRITPATDLETGTPLDADIDSYAYNPTGVTVGNDINYTYNNYTLVENIDYKITYKNNKVPGKATYTVTFIGNFKGNKPVTGSFTILSPSLSDTSTISAVSADKFYNRAGVYNSSPIVTYNGTTVKSSEYTVEYYLDEEMSEESKMTSKNKLEIKEGIAYATVYVKIISKGKIYAPDTYTTCTYKVWRKTSDVTKNLSNVRITFTNATNNKVAYTGKALKPSIKVEVKSNGKYVTVSKNNYSVIYYNNINTGKATVMIKAKEGRGYVGCKTATFTITQKVIN
jgi:surface protein